MLFFSSENHCHHNLQMNSKIAITKTFGEIFKHLNTTEFS